MGKHNANATKPAATVQAPAATPAATPTVTATGAAAAALVAALPPGSAKRCAYSNGARQPQPGNGKCRAVWDACTAMVAAGQVPTPAALKQWAAANGANATNAVIELYAWRKFNGITGRVAAPAQPAPAAQ